jgi:cytochrome P450
MHLSIVGTLFSCILINEMRQKQVTISMPMHTSFLSQQSTQQTMAWPSPSPPELLFSIPCLLLFLYYYFHYFISSKNKQLAVLEHWPVVGMMPGLILNVHNLHTWITDLLRVCCGNFYFRGSWFSGMNIFVTSDPLNIQHIFTSNFQNYPKGEEFLKIFHIILGDGIINSDAANWKAQRVKAQQLITQPRFRAYVAQSIWDKVEKALLPFLAHASNQGQVIDMQDVFLRLTFDISTKLVFGVDPNCLSIELPLIPFARAMDDANEALLFRHVMPMAVWKLLRKLNLWREKKLADASRVIDQFVEQSIEKRRAEKKEAKEKENFPDLLSSYINDNETGKLDKFLRDTVVTLMLAGRDTTGAGLSWFLWLLTQNRRVEKKILTELNSIPHSFTSDGMVIFNPEELTKSVYLHAALNETLRLFPPIPFEHKGVLKDDMLPSGFLATPGVKILISTYSMARMEGVWGKDCSVFKPERWISDKNKLKYEPSYKFLSFNTGPRTCLGKDIAFTQMKAAAAALVYNFYFEVEEGHVIAPKHSIILQMKNGLMVKVKKRSDCDCRLGID